MAVRAHGLRFLTVPVGELSVGQIKQMYELMTVYYHMHSLEKFAADLALKTDALIMTDAGRSRTFGFCFVQIVSLVDQRGSKGQGYYYGDMVIHQKYWGSTAFYEYCRNYLVINKLKRPIIGHYNLVLSKAFKTYLKIANNFNNYYPRPQPKSEDGRLKHLRDQAFLKLCSGFGATYDPDTGLLSEHDKNEPVKDSAMGQITSQMRKENELIHFYEAINPQWAKGVHVGIISEITWPDLIIGTIKMVKKNLIKRKQYSALLQDKIKTIYSVSRRYGKSS